MKTGRTVVLGLALVLAAAIGYASGPKNQTTVDFSEALGSLAPDQSVGVWLAPTPDTFGTFFPLVSGEKEVMVPADTPVLPLLVEHGVPVAAGDLMYLAAGERRRVHELSTKATPVVVASIRFDSHAVAPEVRALLEPAEIALISQGKAFKSMYALYDGSDTNTLVFFRDVPAGAAELRVKGRFWRPTRLLIDIAAKGVTAVKEPIALVPAGALTVSWSRPPSATKPTTAVDDCPADASLEALVRSVILRCAEGATGESCERAGSRAFPLTAGSIEFGGLEPGRYVAEVTLPMAPPSRASALVVPGRTTTAQLAIPEGFSFFGRVTLNGKPIRARVFFQSGQASTDESGSYVAGLSADPRDNIVSVLSCADGRVFKFVPPDRPSPNAPFDVAIDVSRVTVRVVDAADQPLEGASVFFGPSKRMQPDGPEFHYTSRRVATNSAGEAVFEEIPTADGVVVCATRNDHPRKCTAPLSKTTVAEGRVVVQMDSASGVHGKVAGHDGTGSLAIIRPGGTVAEQVPIASDGAFSLRSQPASPEYLIYVSDRRPLTLLAIPAEWRAGSEMVIPLPSTPARSFVVRIRGQGKPGLVGVWVGGLYVPAQILAIHQDGRGMDVRVKPGRSLRIMDIAETAPIAVAFAPEDENSTEFVDVFTLPEYASIHRAAVGASEVTLHP